MWDAATSAAWTGQAPLLVSPLSWITLTNDHRRVISSNSTDVWIRISLLSVLLCQTDYPTFYLFPLPSLHPSAHNCCFFFLIRGGSFFLTNLPWHDGSGNKSIVGTSIGYLHFITNHLWQGIRSHWGSVCCVQQRACLEEAAGSRRGAGFGTPVLCPSPFSHSPWRPLL